MESSLKKLLKEKRQVNVTVANVVLDPPYSTYKKIVRSYLAQIINEMFPITDESDFWTSSTHKFAAHIADIYISAFLSVEENASLEDHLHRFLTLLSIYAEAQG
jgi:hypothetical protein